MENLKKKIIAQFHQFQSLPLGIAGRAIDSVSTDHINSYRRRRHRRCETRRPYQRHLAVGDALRQRGFRQDTGRPRFGRIWSEGRFVRIRVFGTSRFPRPNHFALNRSCRQNEKRKGGQGETVVEEAEKNGRQCRRRKCESNFSFILLASTVCVKVWYWNSSPSTFYAF